MTKSKSIIRKIAPISMSLCLALCLVFSSLSAYTTETFFNNDITTSTFSKVQLEQDFVHHTVISKIDFLAEITDTEEDDDFVYKKNPSLFNIIIKTLWTYSLVETDNLSAIEYAEIPVTKISEPCYIEYCSLKIPS